MTSTHWQDVPRANFMLLHAARLQAHYAAQWLARAARAYVPERPHDGHTNLGWDAIFGGFATHPLPDGSRLGLRIADLTLAFLDVHPHALPLDGRADAEVRTWLGGHVAARNLALRQARRSVALRYAGPCAGARRALFARRTTATPSRCSSTWASNAHAALASVQKRLAAKKLKAPRSTLLAASFRSGHLVDLGRGRSMGIGYCPGDEFCDEPYFYTSMWPEPSIPNLPLLPAMAHWHTYKFLAALAPAHKIVAAHDQGSSHPAVPRCVGGGRPPRAAI